MPDALGAATLRASTRADVSAATTFDVPLLAGDHVTDDAGTGFVHTAPGPRPRGLRPLDGAAARAAAERGIDTRIPYTVDENGVFTDDAPGFEGKRVINDKGEKGDANEAVIKALDRGRQPRRARQAQAPVSAFLALEEARHLPQHAAMVHRDGQADRRQAHPARDGAESDRRNPLGSRPRARTASAAWSTPSRTG